MTLLSVVFLFWAQMMERRDPGPYVKCSVSEKRVYCQDHDGNLSAFDEPQSDRPIPPFQGDGDPSQIIAESDDKLVAEASLIIFCVAAPFIGIFGILEARRHYIRVREMEHNRQ